MVSKNFNVNVIARTCLLALTALFIGWLIFKEKTYFLAVIGVMVFIIQILELINFLNRTNRKIAFFFDAIRNEDSTLYFPENTGNNSLTDLNKSLNKVNILIKDIKFELQEQEQYFKTIIEHISTGIITYNKSGTIFLSNSTAKKLLHHEHLTHIDQISRIDKKLYAILKEIQPGDQKMVTINGNQGTIQLSLKSMLFKTSNEELQLVTIQDIKNELETTELESWIKLIRVLTHEIMNSIAPITSLSQTILGYFKNSEKNQLNEKIIGNTIKGLEIINERGIGLISFVDSYRKLTKLPQPKKENIHIKNLCEKIITLTSVETHEFPVKFKIDIFPANMEIYADEKQLSQVLINLIKNSKESLVNNQNGNIIITGQINELGKPQLEVIDNGRGIPTEIANKIFIPFFTTKESGSGIGLSLSRQIILKHGGNMNIKSVAGKTTVTLVF
jgi:nitrogen fixation/metabolism regulation signal transduction histidine kinase